MSWSTPTNYLKNVATWFSDIFDMFFWFLDQFGWYWIVMASICGYMIFRLIVLPLVGGKLRMGSDHARHRPNKVAKAPESESGEE